MSTQAVLTGSYKDSKFSNYILYRIKSNRTKIILNAVFGLLAYPALAVGICFAAYMMKMDALGINYDRNINDLSTMLVVISLFAGVGFAVLAYLNGISSFDYYYKRSVVDMNYSLPITRRERFFGDFIAGIIPMLTIYAISAVIGIVIVLIGGGEIMNQPDYNVWGLAFGIIFGGIVFLLFVYSLVVFSTGLCGRFFEAAVYPFVISGLVPGIIAIFYYFLFNHPTLMYENELYTVLMIASPFGFLGGYINEASELVTGLAQAPVFRPEIIIPVLSVITGLIFVSYVLSQKRVTERVGSPFVFKGVYHVYLTGILFSITSPFIMNYEDFTSAMAVALIISTAVTFLVIDVITNRGFKKMGRAALRYVSTVGGTLILGFALMAFDSFGLYKYVPKTEDILSVKVFSYNDFSANERSVSAFEIETAANSDKSAGNSFGGHEGILFEEPENIEAILNYHRGVVETNQNRGYGNATIHYLLKNGNIVSRNALAYNEFPSAIYDSREYKQKELNVLDKMIEAANISGGELELQINGNRFNNSPYMLERNKREAFIEALKADYLKAAPGVSLGEYLGSVSINTYNLNLSNVRNNYRYIEFELYTSYENIMALLEGSEFLEGHKFSYYNYTSFPLRIHFPREGYVEESPAPEIVRGPFGATSYYTPMQDNMDYIDIPEGWHQDLDLMKLVKGAIPSEIYRRQSDYRIEFAQFGVSLDVPEYFNDLAEELIEKYK